ncbi:hypothetical protein SAMN05216355_11914 [Actinomyces ruminicola]|uniref:CorA-like Mg2+ transporter protein n=1 Tax=Actinomyces ruminicola TaxID=332524 RepID=A0A1H0EUB6_9ACTO|nr:hypothetical protein [Actinomyces ruminicola]SDN85923.1 hypothetical protein SAMN05216355_11914 [Actinomyces ruminicola]
MIDGAQGLGPERLSLRRQRPQSGPSEPPRTGFIDLNDPGEMRIVFFWRLDVGVPWETAFSGWTEGPLAFRVEVPSRRHIVADHAVRAGYFHDEVAARLLSPDQRRSLILRQCQEYRDSGDGAHGGAVLCVEGLEVLRFVSDDGSDSAILVVHAIVPDPNRLLAGLAYGDADGLSSLGAMLNRLLGSRDVCNSTKVALACEPTGGGSEITSPLRTLTWIPLSLSEAWFPRFGESVEELGGRMGVQVSAEVVDEIRRSTDGVHARRRLPEAVLAASGWCWGELAYQSGIELGGGAYATAQRNTHVLSQSWAVTVWERGVAYIPRQHDEFILEALLRACSINVDVCLLILLDELNVRLLSKRLADTAQRLRALRQQRHGTSDARRQEECEGELIEEDALIEEAIDLDSDAVAFVASEWRTDITKHRQADLLLAWMQDVGGLDHGVRQVIEQARLLRESVQTLIERQERVADRERQESAHVLERAVGILAFVGLPLSVVLEVWSNLYDGGPRLHGVFGCVAGLGMFVAALVVARGLYLWLGPRARSSERRGRRRER